MRLITISEATNSSGRSGLMKRLPTLRECISSRKDSENPSWPRNSTSHSITAPISVPAPTASRPELPPAAAVWPTKRWMKPQVTSCTVGQYMRSASRGQDPRKRYE